jgi:hypothetical protein
MTQNDNPIYTEQDQKRLLEVYLSGFMSGAASAMITSGVSETRAATMSRIITEAIEHDEGAMRDAAATIMACMEDRDLPDGPIREVQNVHLPE